MYVKLMRIICTPRKENKMNNSKTHPKFSEYLSFHIQRYCLIANDIKHYARMQLVQVDDLDSVQRP